MKKLYVTKKKEETTSEIGKFCGFTVEDGRRGGLFFFGSEEKDRLHAIFSEEVPNVPNRSFGSSDCDFSSVPDFVNNHETRLYGLGAVVKSIYFFDSLKELFAWLAED